MFKVNDVVMYASYGVCEIAAIEEKDFSGENVEYYILRPISDSRNTFYVPTNKEALTQQMRRVYTKSEVEELIKAIPDAKLINLDDDSQRKEKFREIISGGDREELIRLIKTLFSRRQELAQRNKRLRAADEKFLNDAENMLHDEFAYALGIKKDEVISYIRSHTQV